jgi:retinol dehydrogenase-12
MGSRSPSLPQGDSPGLAQSAPGAVRVTRIEALPLADAAGQPSLHGRVALVTGGTRGIGLAVARGLLARGARVLVTGRDAAAGARAVEALRRGLPVGAHADPAAAAQYMQVDACDQSDVRALAAQVRAAFTRLDLLVHNAAFVADAWRATQDGVEAQFAANHLAVMTLTWELLPMLHASAPARVVVTASQVERGASTSFATLAQPVPITPYAPNGVYAQTKLANMLFCRVLARQLAGSGVTVNALHPGVVRTGLLDALERSGRAPAPGLRTRLRASAGSLLRRAGLRAPIQDWAIDTERGARTTLAVATSPALAETQGSYFMDERLATPSATSLDDALAQSLWLLSNRRLGLPVDWSDRLEGRQT